MKLTRRILALLLVVFQLVSLCPAVSVAAEETSAPYVTFAWLDNWGEGWFENPDADICDGLNIFPGWDTHNLIFYINYVDDGGEWVSSPISDVSGWVNVHAEKIPEDEIRSGEENGDCFYRISANEWDVDTVLYYDFNGQTVEFWMNASRDAVHFYSTSEPSNESYMGSYQMDPYGDNVYYICLDATDGETGWSVSSFELTDSTVAEYASLEMLDECTIQVTLDKDAVWNRCAAREGFWLDVHLTLTDTEGNSHDCWTGISNEWTAVPYLTWGWLENWGEGWFENTDSGYEEGFNIRPGMDEINLICYINYQNEDGQWVREAVSDIAWNGSLVLEQITEDIREGEENAACFYRVTASEWDVDSQITCEYNGNTVVMNVSTSRGECEFYSSEEMSNDTVLGHYQMDPYGENVYYFGFQSDYWTLVNVEAPEDWSGGDKVTVDKVSDNVYKITLNEGVAYEQCANREGFHLYLRVIVQDEWGNRNEWDCCIWNEWTQMPYLTFGWLENWGEGWFENTDSGYDEGFSIRPGMEFNLIFYVNYQNEDGQWVREAVSDISCTGSLNLEQITEDIRDGEENAACFYRVTAGEWDVDSQITYEYDGNTLVMNVSTSRGECEFYSSEEMSNETVLSHYQMDPYGENVYYFGFQSDYWTLVNVEAPEDWSGCDKIILEQVSEYVYKITLNDGVAYEHCANRGGFSLDLRITVQDECGNQNEWSCGIWNEWTQMPYLTFGWLEYWGEGWFENTDSGYDEGFSIKPGIDEYYFIFYINYQNEDGQWVREAVSDISCTGSLNLEQITEDIRDGEANAACFYRVTASEWDVDSQITCEYNGNTVTMNVSTSRGECEFYSSEEMSNETVLNTYQMDPDGENVYYFGFQSDYWTLVNVEAPEDWSGCDKITLEQVSDNVYKITLNEGVAAEMCQNGEGFELALLTTVQDEWGNQNEWSCFIWNEPTYVDTTSTFSSFEELQAIVAEYTLSGEFLGALRYTGEEDLVITEDLSIPSSIRLRVMDQALIVAEGATLQLDTMAMVGQLTVNGHLDCRGLYVTGNLTVNGTMTVSTQITLEPAATITCEENISFGDNAIVCLARIVSNMEELMESLAECEADTNEYHVYSVEAVGELIIDADMTLPSDFQLMTYEPVTVVKGCTLTTGWIPVFCGEVTVEGTLVNAEGILLFGDGSIQLLKVADGGTYSGPGSIRIYGIGDGDCAQLISGVDLDCFTREYDENSGYQILTPIVPEAPVVKSSTITASGKIKVSWDAVEGAEKYMVYRSTDGKNFKRLTTTTKTYVNNTSAVAGVKYYYYVVAVSPLNIYSEKSNTVSRYCDCAQPVITLSNIASSGKVKIKWEAVDGAEKYELWCATSKNGTYKRLITTEKLYVNHNSGVAGTTYYYKVRAIAEVSNASSVYSAVAYRCCDLARPEIKLTNVASSGKIKVSWEAVEGATKYEVYRSTEKNGKYTRLITTKNLYVTNTSAVAGKTYYYKVRAICGVSAATSAYSAVGYRCCDLARPVVSLSRNSSGNPVIKWDAIEGATKYEVWYATSKNGTYKKLITTKNTKVVNSSAVAGKTYYYKVRAICGVSSATSAYSAVKYIKAK